MGKHPIKGGVEILLVASCCRNRDKLRPDGPLDSYADLTFYVHFQTAHLTYLYNNCHLEARKRKRIRGFSIKSLERTLHAPSMATDDYTFQCNGSGEIEGP